jgi:AcrR family transcriptional regulator
MPARPSSSASDTTDSEPAGPGARRRSGPRPGNTESRRKIVAAAVAAFAANGYAGTSLRGVAREAGVDPSLIVHFFGSKAGLFAAVVGSMFDPDVLIADLDHLAPDRVPAYIAAQFLANWGQDERRNPLISLISAALADEIAAKLLREFLTTNLTLPMVRQIGADQPELRAALLSSQLVGLGLARYALGFDALRDASDEQLLTRLTDTIQRTCTGLLPGAVT